MDCYACRHNDQFDQLPPRERIAADPHWRVAHAFNTTLHVTTIAELSDDEAVALGTWQVRLSRCKPDSARRAHSIGGGNPSPAGHAR